MDNAKNWKERLSSNRWHNFLPMQKRTATKLQNIICVSQSSKEDVIAEFNVKEDSEVNAIFNELFPDREIVMLETENINYGGGNIHCITMNVPKI